MKKILVLLFLVSILACNKNNLKDDSPLKLATVRKEYTVSHSFQIFAPNAKEVILEFPNKTEIKLGKAADGIWFKTILLKSGKNIFRYKVDGKYQLEKAYPYQTETISKKKYSYIIVPKENEFTLKNELHSGQIDQIYIKTKSHGNKYPFNVYLPPNYDTSYKYPVLFLMHGYSQDQNTWIVNGIKEHMDNLIEKGYIKPFIIIMPLTNVVMENFNDFEPFRTAHYKELILDEVYTYVKKHYSISNDREKTAISGFSMGGTMAFGFGINNQDIFGLAIPQAAWLPLKAVEELIVEDEKNGINIELSFYCGREDDLYLLNQEISKVLDKRKIDYNYNISPGGHSGEFTVKIMKDVLMEISDFFYRY